MRQGSIVAISDWRQDRYVRKAEPRPEDCWPEVCSHCPTQAASPGYAANSQKRILLEVFLVLAGAGMMAAATALWLPLPT